MAEYSLSLARPFKVCQATVKLWGVIREGCSIVFKSRIKLLLQNQTLMKCQLGQNIFLWLLRNISSSADELYVSSSTCSPNNNRLRRPSFSQAFGWIKSLRFFQALVWIGSKRSSTASRKYPKLCSWLNYVCLGTRARPRTTYYVVTLSPMSLYVPESIVSFQSPVCTITSFRIKISKFLWFIHWIKHCKQ